MLSSETDVKTINNQTIFFSSWLFQNYFQTTPAHAKLIENYISADKTL